MIIQKGVGVSKTTIYLEDDQMKYGIEVGEKKYAISSKKGRKGAYGADDLSPEKSLRSTVDGDLAELAASLLLNEEWKPVFSPQKSNEPDLGFDIQIRHTRYGFGSLITHVGNDPLHRYILVTGDALPGHEWPRKFTMEGWLYGIETFRPEHLNNKKCRTGKEYWTPQNKLRPMAAWQHLVKT